jgi:hypothetical protein
MIDGEPTRLTGDAGLRRVAKAYLSKYTVTTGASR